MYFLIHPLYVETEFAGRELGIYVFLVKKFQVIISHVFGNHSPKLLPEPTTLHNICE